MSTLSGKYIRTVVAALVMTSSIWSGPVANAASTPELVRVEEDWVMYVGEPDSATSSPQVLNIISPRQDMDGVFGLIQMNHQGTTAFIAGGQQVQGWVGGNLAATASGTKNAVLYRTSDSIRYTVAMVQVPTGIRFELRNGRSRTWGRFAYYSPVSVTIPTAENSLSQYTTDFSTSSSMVNLGAHRIAALYITATRLTYSDGSVVTDDTDRYTHRYQLSIEDIPLETYEANPEEYEVEITE